MSGMSSTGFDRKRLDEILDELRTGFALIFGADLNTSPESPDGQVIGLVAAAYAELWELAEGSYDAFNPSVAVGAALTNLVQLNAITRQPAVASTAVLTLTGTQGVTVPAGSLVSSIDATSTFSTDEDVVFPPSGTVDVGSTCVVDGPTTALEGTLTVIDTPVTGWDSVTNAADAVIGAFAESDSALRARRSRSISRSAVAIADSIIAEVLDVEAVTHAILYENDLDITDPITMTPPKSFQVVVRGGLDEDIAQAIYIKKCVGIQAFGTTIVPVTDIQGIPHDIGFTRPLEKLIYVTLNITTFPNYPPDGADIIKQAIIDYANGELIAGRGFGVGDDIINSELYCPANTVIGMTIDSLLQGTTPTPTASDDLSINFDQIGIFEEANIIVNETPSP